jgi:hypothetical protein
MGTLTSTETDRLAAYTVGASASTGPFPITFPFADNDDIAVYVNGTKISTYAVTQGSAYGTSGNFVTLETGVTNSTVSVVSEASAVRSTTDSLTLTALNGEIDNIYANLQENQFDKTRSMNAPLTDPTTSNMTLPSHTARAGRLLGFNSTTGNPEAGPDIASVSTLTQISADIGTVAGISANVTTVAGISSSVISAASNSTAISSVAGIASNVTTVAGIAANVTAVAGKTTEITDLSTSANITNMATLGASGVVSNIATVASVSSSLAGAAANAQAAADSAELARQHREAVDTAFDNFDDRYLGSKSSEPSVDNDSESLVSGALFFDNSAGSMKVYDGANWILATSAGASSLLDYEYTATAGQTTFSGADNNSATLSYSAGNVIVSLNGIILDNGSDYTATSGTSIVLDSASPAAAGDHLAVIAFKSFTVADTVAASTGGTFAGGVTVSGTVTATAAQVNGNIQVTGTVDGRDVAANIPASLGTAGQVLTVNPAGNAGAWADASSGGEQTFTATGAITAGDLVSLNTNGTISKSKSLLGATSTFSSSDIRASCDSAYDSDTDRVIVAWVDDTSRVGKIAIGTVSDVDNSVTYGTALDFDTGFLGGTTNWIKVVYDPSTQRGLIIYMNGGYNILARTITVTGGSTNTAAVGASATLEVGSVNSREAYRIGTAVDMMFCPTINKIVVIFANTTGVGRACIIIPNASTNTVTFGTEVTVSTDIEFNFVSMDYDVANNIVGFSYESDANDGYFNCLTPNANNTVTAGSEIEPRPGSITFTQCIYDPIADNFVAMLLNGNNVYFEFIHVDSSRVMTELNSVNFRNDYQPPYCVFNSIYNPSTSNVYNFGEVGLIFLSKFGSPSIVGFNTVSSPVQWSGHDTSTLGEPNCNPTLISNGRVFLAVRDTLTDTGKSIVVDDLIASPVGLAAESISDTASGKVTVAGGINTHQSGLTSGSSYLASLQGAAELVTIADNLPFTGPSRSLPVQAIAQSATAVYVTGFTPLISTYFRK